MLDYINVDITISSDNPFLFAYIVLILNITFTNMLSK